MDINFDLSKVKNIDLPDLPDLPEGKIDKLKDTLQQKTSEFHESFVSKVVPKDGIFGKVADFAGDMIPGSSVYEDIRKGDWHKVPTDVAIEVAMETVIPAAIIAGTAGVGIPAAIGAKAGLAKVAGKLTGEVGEKVAKSITGEATEKVAKSITGEAVEKTGKQLIEETSQQVAEVGTTEAVEQASKEVVGEVSEGAVAGSGKNLDNLGEKTVKDVSDQGPKLTAKEIAEELGHPFSDDIVQASESAPEQLCIFVDNGLTEGDVNGRRALKKDHLLIREFRKPDGTIEKINNLDRMTAGKPPIGSDGKPIELHHIGQTSDAPLAELEASVHRKNHGKLHNLNKKSEIDRVKFAKEKSDYWKARAAEIKADLGVTV